MQTAVGLKESSNKTKPLTYGEFFRRHGPELVVAATKAGVPYEDARDILQDTLVDLMSKGDLPPESELTKQVLVEKVKPALFGAFGDSVLSYWGSDKKETPTEELTTDERLKDFLVINIGQMVLEHLFKGVEPIDGDVHEIPKYKKTWEFRREVPDTLEAQQEIYAFCRSEVFDALLQLDPSSIAELKERYSFTAQQKQFDRLANSTPHCLERQLANFVAYGAVNMSPNDLLSTPLFYEALSYALEMIDVGSTESYDDQPSFLSRKAIKSGSNRNNRTKTANEKNVSRLKRYAHEYGIGSRWASRIANYADRKGLNIGESMNLVRKLSSNPEFEVLFQVDYRRQMQQRR